MDKHFKEINSMITQAIHKPRVSFNCEYGCYQCTDGGLTFYGETALDAYNTLVNFR